MRRALAIAGAVLVLVTGCTGTGAGEGRISAHGPGLVDVVRANGATTALAGSTTLHRGDGVRIPTSGGGTATVSLPGGGTLELRAGSIVRFVDGPQLGGGDLLVLAAGHTVTVGASASTAAVVHGAARLRRDLTFTVGVYQGNATVTSATRSLNIGAYRQASIAAVGLVPDAPSPLMLSGTDAWDRRELGAAIDLTEQLDAASRGFTASVPSGVPTSAGFFRTALTQLPPTFTDALLTRAPVGPSLPSAAGQRAPGEVLVGAAIVTQGKSGGFERRWQSVFAFRDAGAAWGLVAFDQGIDSHPLLDTLSAAINRSLLVFTQAPPPPIVAAAPTPSPSTPGLLASPPVTRVPGRTATTTPPASHHTLPTTPTLTVPTVPTPPPTPASPVLDPVVQLLNGLVGALLPAKH
jgi:hypothetical protein